jgi:hypothetical protein
MMPTWVSAHIIYTAFNKKNLSRFSTSSAL